MATNVPVTAVPLAERISREFLVHHQVCPPRFGPMAHSLSP